MTDQQTKLAAVMIVLVGTAVSAVVGLFGWWLFLKLLVRLFGPL